MPGPGLTIAVIGSGTAGLAAALFLTKDGHQVTIFEKYVIPRPVGAGILLQPTGLACLSALGLGEKILQYGARITDLYGRAMNGKVVFDIRYGDLKPHYFGLGIHRGALFSVLHDEAVRLRIKIVSSCDIVKTVIEGEYRTIFDLQGEHRGSFDLVIDASGARSVLRQECGYLRYHKPYPYAAVWGVCEDPGQKLCGHSLQQRYEDARVMIGGLSIGKRPLDQKETLAFFWSLPATSYTAWRESDFNQWKQYVGSYWPEIEPYLQQFSSPDDLTFAQYSDTIMMQWHNNRLVFIGDAAHCTSPQLGQGANLALADALTLATCLKEDADVNTALVNYSKLRKSHVSFYQVASRWLTPLFQSESIAAAWLRDNLFGIFCKTPYVRTEMLRTLSGIKTGLFTHLNPGAWHPDYDLKRKSF